MSPGPESETVPGPESKAGTKFRLTARPFNVKDEVGARSLAWTPMSIDEYEYIETRVTQGPGEEKQRYDVRKEREEETLESETESRSGLGPDLDQRFKQGSKSRSRQSIKTMEKAFGVCFSLL
ncbi:hypothetical protein EVAR_34796_1 [Eumeta japonica]|uniref:Uncharacterized protein n=1 Tax=Eumeta variegata TaxID=151549 RepID=A0A4C1WB78_EUMVA|nr:hypothetical protein EVAR_34796_1 [Eumeta japonica]